MFFRVSMRADDFTILNGTNGWKSVVKKKYIYFNEKLKMTRKTQYWSDLKKQNNFGIGRAPNFAKNSKRICK